MEDKELKTTRKTVTPPRQARSRHSLDAIVEATKTIMAEKGHDGVTVPEVVARSGCSVGCFYGRFENKEALLQYVNQQLFRNSEAGWRDFLDPKHWEGASALQIIEGTMRAVVDCTRTDEAMLRAITNYWHSQEPDDAIRETAARYYDYLFRGFTDLILARREEITHPNPEFAVRFAFELIDGTINERILYGKYQLTPLVITDEQLVVELTRTFASYLGIQITNRASV
jgi:AcrR family transcriptional regulator